MTKQNKYDEPGFFANYSQMARSTAGLEAAGEWPAFRALLPDFSDKKVLDLGCGFGWHSRYARKQGASKVLGIDLSHKMLSQARAMTADPAIEYLQGAIEDIDFGAGSFDVVVSSLALHYVADFKNVCQKVYQILLSGGQFIFSVEHPIFTALAAQDWYYSQEGVRLHWPVDHYQEEGLRQTSFLDHQVVKYHRTIGSYINTLIEAGFTLRKLCEPQPTAQALEVYPQWQDETRRPMFLLVAAFKQEY